MSAPSVQLKGSLFTLTVLQLSSPDMRKLHAELLAKIQLAPNFFSHAPVVVDISELKDDAKKLDFNELKDILIKNSLVPVGVKGASKEIQAIAIEAGFACIGENSTPSGIKPEEKEKKQTKAAPAATQAATEVINENDRSFTLVTQPVRSGQQVYSSGDLVILAPVSPGAELLAEGNIHIYDRMRGRALAGINGDTDVRVFCKQLEAELIAIAGEYQVFEHTEYPHMSKPTQIYLREGKLIAEPL